MARNKNGCSIIFSLYGNYASEVLQLWSKFRNCTALHCSLIYFFILRPIYFEMNLNIEHGVSGVILHILDQLDTGHKFRLIIKWIVGYYGIIYHWMSKFHLGDGWADRRNTYIFDWGGGGGGGGGWISHSCVDTSKQDCMFEVNIQILVQSIWYKETCGILRCC